ncbi:MAG: DUF2752 domain-containing protein [Pedosphaera sp.]|nr:DUF2752 domain-containing protein [Pedosphaera sp.]
MSLLRSVRVPLLVLLGCLGASGIARVAIDGHWPLPRCAFHAVTGLPCFTCGSTRALAALGRLDFTAALTLNPLVTLLVLAAPVWPILAASNLHGRLPGRWKLWLCLLVASVIANWFYLVRTLPR